MAFLLQAELHATPRWPDGAEVDLELVFLLVSRSESQSGRQRLELVVLRGKDRPVSLLS